jgi:hypothetical protein
MFKLSGEKFHVLVVLMARHAVLGALYHVVVRGIEQRAIFRDDV